MKQLNTLNKRILLQFIFCTFLAICFIQDRNIDQYDMSPSCSTTTESAMQCHQLCRATENCKAFTWINKNRDILGSYFDNKCCLKTHFTNLKPVSGAVSGSYFCEGKYFGNLTV